MTIQICTDWRGNQIWGSYWRGKKNRTAFISSNFQSGPLWTHRHMTGGLIKYLISKEIILLFSIFMAYVSNSKFWGLLYEQVKSKYRFCSTLKCRHQHFSLLTSQTLKSPHAAHPQKRIEVFHCIPWKVSSLFWTQTALIHILASNKLQSD